MRVRHWSFFWMKLFKIGSDHFATHTCDFHEKKNPRDAHVKMLSTTALYVMGFAASPAARLPALHTQGRTAAVMAAPAAGLEGLGPSGHTNWRPEGSHGTGYRFMPLDTVSTEPGPMLVCIHSGRPAPARSVRGGTRTACTAVLKPLAAVEADL